MKTPDIKTEELSDAIFFLVEQYDKALRTNKKTPVSYALYHTWRYFDSKNKKKGGKDERN